jgi:hypothetical protein
MDTKHLLKIKMSTNIFEITSTAFEVQEIKNLKIHDDFIVKTRGLVVKESK